MSAAAPSVTIQSSRRMPVSVEDLRSHRHPLAGSNSFAASYIHGRLESFQKTVEQLSAASPLISELHVNAFELLENILAEGEKGHLSQQEVLIATDDLKLQQKKLPPATDAASRKAQRLFGCRAPVEAGRSGPVRLAITLAQIESGMTAQMLEQHAAPLNIRHEDDKAFLRQHGRLADLTAAGDNRPNAHTRLRAMAVIEDKPEGDISQIASKHHITNPDEIHDMQAYAELVKSKKGDVILYEYALSWAHDRWPGDGGRSTELPAMPSGGALLAASKRHTDLVRTAPVPEKWPLLGAVLKDIRPTVLPEKFVTQLQEAGVTDTAQHHLVHRQAQMALETLHDERLPNGFTRLRALLAIDHLKTPEQVLQIAADNHISDEEDVADLLIFAARALPEKAAQSLAFALAWANRSDPPSAGVDEASAALALLNLSETQDIDRLGSGPSLIFDRGARTVATNRR